MATARLGSVLSILVVLGSSGCKAQGATPRERGRTETGRAAPQAAAQPRAPSTSVSSAALAELPLPELPRGLSYVTGPELLERVRHTEARGVLVNVWASWCGPCRVEVPMMLNLSQNLGEDEIEFVFVSVDSPDKANAAFDFLDQHQMKLPGYIARPPLGAFKRAMTPRWKGSLPASFLFDSTGKLRYFWGAQVFEQEITPILQRFLSGEAVDGEARFQIRRGGEVP